MKKSKKLTKKLNKIMKVKTGTVEEFFSNVRSIMQAADRKQPIADCCATLTFVDPTEMMSFLSESKIKLINSIRNHPDSITNIAKMVRRKRSAVYRDINEMEKFGLVRMHEEINPGHGRHKIVELIAAQLKLEAYL